MLAKLAVKTKVILGFGLILSFLIVSIVFTYVSLENAISISTYDKVTTQKLLLAAKASEGLVQRLSTIRGYLLTGKDANHAQFEKAKLDFSATMATLHELLRTEEGKRLWQNSEDLSVSYTAAVDQAAQLKKGGKTQEAVDLYFSPQVANLRLQLQESIDVQSAHFQSEHAAASNKLQSVASVKTLSLVLGIVGLLLGGTIAYLLGNWFANAVKQTNDFVRELSNNNLAIPDLVSATEDEVGEMHRALNTMKNQLHEVILGIASTAGTLAAASEELSASAAQISLSSETQRDQTTQVATAIQQMSVTVQEVSLNSAKASTNAHASGELAIGGGKIVEDTVGVIKSVADSTRDTAVKIEQLGKSSDQIGRIIGVIDDIADQTNLLALNAAIEAARAGEQGRGFAVVADEVRKLAERTSTATKEIASMIETIQKETKSAVGAMHSGTDRVDEGVKAASRAGEALKAIIESSESMQEMVTMIATAATEQAAATEQVNGNVGEITKMAQQSSIGAEQSATPSQLDHHGVTLANECQHRLELGTQRILAAQLLSETAIDLDAIELPFCVLSYAADANVSNPLPRCHFRPSSVEMKSKTRFGNRQKILKAESSLTHFVMLRGVQHGYTVV